MKKKFTVSKKAATALITGAVIVLNEAIGLDLSDGQIVAFVGVAITYIYSQSKVDQKLVENGLKDK